LPVNACQPSREGARRVLEDFMRRIVAVIALLAACFASIASAAEARFIGIKLSGTVRDVVTVDTTATGLSGGSRFSTTYLDLDTVSIGRDVNGNHIFKTVRLNCAGSEASCLALAKGDAIKVTADLHFLRSGFGETTGFALLTLQLQ